MPDDILLRLRRQSLLLSEQRQAAPGLWRNDVLRELDVRHDRPRDLATRRLLDRLAAHGDALLEAQHLASATMQSNDAVIETGQSMNTDLTQVARTVTAARDHVALALAGDEAAKAADLAIMRIVQEANLEGYGGTTAS